MQVICLVEETQKINEYQVFVIVGFAMQSATQNCFGHDSKLNLQLENFTYSLYVFPMTSSLLHALF